MRVIVSLVFTSVLLVIAFFSVNKINAQPNLNSNFPCYTIASIPNGTSTLYELNPTNNKWRTIGIIDRSNIKALAIDSATNILYSVDGNMLGTINPVTAEFKDIGTIGSGAGVTGSVLLNDVYGLTNVPNEDVLYATHRIFSFDRMTNTAVPNSNDILFKINKNTGSIIKDAFYNDSDYIQIEGIDNSTNTIPKVYDVTDIVYNTKENQLLVLNGYQLPLVDAITVNSVDDGSLESVITFLSKPSIGISIDLSYNTYITTIPDPISNNNSADIYKINLTSVGASRINTIDETLTEPTYFNCIDCTKRTFNTSNCQPAIYVNNYVALRSNYIAKDNLYSNKDNFTSSVTFKAGESVTLGNHFTITKDIDFSALIESCN